MDLLEAFCWDEEEAEAQNSTLHISPRLQKQINKQIKINKKFQKRIDKYNKKQLPVPQYLQDEMRKQELNSKELLEIIRSS